MSYLKSLVTLLWLPVVVALSLSACNGAGSQGDSQSYSIGGSVTGLTGSVVLQNNGGDDLVITGDGDFSFATAVADTGSYTVTVSVQPATQTCTVANDSDSINGADITNVTVTCVTPVLTAEARPASVALSWNNTGAAGYNVFYSSAPDCDIDNYMSCAGGTMLANVASPYTVTGLAAGKNYWFKLESVAGGGNATSTEAGTQPYRIGTNDTVRTIAHDADGVIYLGGDFTQVGRATGHGVPLNTSTGLPGAFPQVQGTVYAAVSDGAGGYYIGGLFDTVDGQARGNLAHILADGSLGSWQPAASFVVYTLAVSGSTVYVGGQFTTIDDGNGAQPREYLAAVGTDGTLSSSWQPAANGSVRALATSGNTVYVGGFFTSLDDGSGAQTRKHLAAIGTDGTLSSSWQPSANRIVYTLAVSGSTVYVGGQFTTIDDGSGAQTRNYLAAIGTDGTLSSSWSPGADYFVFALAASDSSVYVGGFFTSIDDGSGAQPRNNLAAIGTDGTLSSSWQPSADSSVYTLAVSGSTVYVGGNFTTIDDGSGVQPRNYLAAIGTDGVIKSWNPGSGNSVHALALSGDTVYVGGSFDIAVSVQRNHLAAIETDGNLSAWDPDADNSVRALAVSGTTVYAGGEFSTVGGTNRNHLAAIDTDGTLSDWNPDADGSVHALAVSNDTVYAGGDFTHVGSDTRNYLAAIGSDGIPTNWSPSPDAGVYAIAVLGGTVYIGGEFFGVDPGTGWEARWFLAAINTDGTLANWNPSASSDVYALAAVGNTVYIGGSFNSVAPLNTVVTRNYLAAINTDGTLSDWNPDAGDIVYALTVSGETVYIGGDFNTIVGQTRNKTAAVGTDGTLSTWNPGTDSTVFALDVAGGSIYVGGDFTTIGGEVSPHFATVSP